MRPLAPKLGDVGERAAVDAVRALLSVDENVLDHDDDAAAVPLPASDAYLVASTDATARATHYPDAATPEDVGWYAAAVSASDVAAMGAEPRGLLAALGLPDETDLDELEGIARGLDACAREAGTEVLGGDTKEQPHLTVATTGLGTVAQDEILPRRAARPGHRVGVTGDLGAAAAGLQALREGRIDRPERLLRPPVRVPEGRALARAGASAAVDLSDGLAVALHQLADAAGVGFRLEAEALPVDPTAAELAPDDARDLALARGGDFELAAAVPPDRAEAVREAVAGAGGRLTYVGEILEAGTRVLEDEAGERDLPRAGWEHFRGGQGGPTTANL